LLERKVRLGLQSYLTRSFHRLLTSLYYSDKLSALSKIESLKETGVQDDFVDELTVRVQGSVKALDPEDDYAIAAFYPGLGEENAADLLSFFHDRLKVYLRDLGARHDIIDAVLTPDADDLLLVARRAEALTAFITSEDGKNLLAGTKRATQLLAAEEKKGTVVANGVSEALLTLDAEKALWAAISQASKEASDAVAKEDFRSAMEALSKLRAPVDTFFGDVLVNDEDAAIRANRLALLKAIREATATVADFSRIVS
jgi:glycyl-tRNA synthetase beta chain